MNGCMYYMCSHKHMVKHANIAMDAFLRIAGPRYHYRQRGAYQSSSHSGHHREYGRFENDRWSHSPRAYNNRHSFHYKPHSEGPAPVAMRGKYGNSYRSLLSQELSQ